MSVVIKNIKPGSKFLVIFFLIGNFILSAEPGSANALAFHSVIPRPGVAATDTFAAPKFTNDFAREVSYGKHYVSAVKISATGSLFETSIRALDKPVWLNFRCEPSLRVFAGGQFIGSSDGNGNKAGFNAPYALTPASDGSIYVTDQVDNRIRKISPAGDVTTIAGAQAAGFKDGPVGDALFSSPSGIAVDQQGNIYVSDQGNNAIRKITPAGVVVTLAGGAKAGLVNGKGKDAAFNKPAGICIDVRGYMYVADRGNNVIRVVTPDGEVSTLAGTGQAGFADGDGIKAQFNVPTGVAIDGSGNVYVADQLNNRIRKISRAGTVSTLAGTGEFSLRDGAADRAAFRYPTGLTVDADLNLYVSDQLNHSVRRISSRTGIVSIIAGGKEAEKRGEAAFPFKNPAGICLNKEGSIVVADYHNHNVKLITLEATLYGTPSKSLVGSHKVVIQASNGSGSAILESQVVVRDTLAPQIIATFPPHETDNVDSITTLRVTFDEEVTLNSSGSVAVYRKDDIVRSFDLKTAADAKHVVLSADQRSVEIRIKDLPYGSVLTAKIGDGLVQDKANNLFLGVSSQLSVWSFTTKPKQKQNLQTPALAEKTYGDPKFRVGPGFSSAGLPIEYYAADPALLEIKGDSARILRAGTTHILAVQKGDKHYMEESARVEVVIRPQLVTIKPYSGQFMIYGSVQPDIKYEISSGPPEAAKTFAGNLNRAKGDSAGHYRITIGSLALNSNYKLNLLQESFEIRKAVLLIKADDHSKQAGKRNPPFSSVYQGFVNGEGPDELFKKPVFKCIADENSHIGRYPIEISEAAARNYTIYYKPGSLDVLPSGSSEFTAHPAEFFENSPAGTTAIHLQQSKEGQPLKFTLVSGNGGEDNSSFIIKGNSIVCAGPLDYETREKYSVLVKSDGTYGESTTRVLTILPGDINERPVMSVIPFNKICANGILRLEGISGGPEKGQNVRVFVKNLSSPGAYFQVSQPVNGLAILNYSLPAKQKEKLEIQVILKDNGGTMNGGTDSTIYHYSFDVGPQAPVEIMSANGTTVVKGQSTYLSAKGAGEFQWYFNKQRIAGQQGSVLNIRAEESGIYSVQIISESGCVTEGRMMINVVESPPVTATNLISPNFDGINDAFFVRNIEHYPKNELWIFDKTGKVVYNTKGYSNNWQGTHYNANLPAGTYYYLIDLGNKTDKLKGYVSLVN